MMVTKLNILKNLKMLPVFILFGLMHNIVFSAGATTTIELNKIGQYIPDTSGMYINDDIGKYLIDESGQYHEDAATAAIAQWQMDMRGMYHDDPQWHSKDILGQYHEDNSGMYQIDTRGSYQADTRGLYKPDATSSGVSQYDGTISKRRAAIHKKIVK